MKETALLLAAKLLPPEPGPFHLTRERLHARIAAGLDGRVTVVLGGPGYGKTSLCARFLQDVHLDTVWLRLDSGDREPWTLFRYLVEAARGRVPDFGEQSAGLRESLRSRPDEVEQLADLFIQDAQETLADRLVIVLDGIEWIESAPECCRALKRLVSYLPPALHLLLTARSLPELGISALASRGEATVIHGDELRFTQEETQKLLSETFGLRVEPETVARVHARTRGWVTALQLLRQTVRLRGETDLPAELFDRTEAEILEYFSEQVLAAEPRASHDFLLVTSLLSVIDPDFVAETVPGCDARGIVASLVQRSLFLSALGERANLYAYDPLFREFLERRLRLERGAREVLALHRSYGLARAARGEAMSALGHLLAAEDVQAVTDLLAREGRSLARAGSIHEVREATLFCLQHGVRVAFLHDLMGEVSRLTGDYAAAVGHFDRALSAQAEGALLGEARANALQGLAYSLLKIGDMGRAREAAERGLQEAGDADPVLSARILNTLSIACYRENRHQEAISGWGRALALSREGGDEQLTLMIAHNLGLPYAVTGDFQRASECFRMLTHDENVRLGPEEGAAYLNLARIATLRGEYPRAASFLDDAREIAQKWKLKALSADVLEAQGNLLRETGHLEAARARYAEARALFTSLGLLDVLDSLAQEEAIAVALSGDLDRAERMAEELVARARGSGSRDAIAPALLALGEIHARCGEPARAKQPLEEAASLFEASGHAYEQCMAWLWLALARIRTGDARGAKAAAEAGLRIAAMFDYDGAVVRVANLDPALRKVVAALPRAPSFLIEESAEETQVAALQPERADLTLRLFGAPEAYRDPERRIPPAAWKVRKALRILCYLAASRSHRATKDRLAEAIWRNARASVIDKNFYPTISFLRRALNHDHHVPKNFVLCEAGAYRLNPAYRYEIDTETFEAKLQEARRKASRKDGAGALADFGVALDLYRGPFLEDDDEEWVLGPRSHYEALYVAALAEAAQLHLEKGDKELALGLLEKRVEHDPTDEEASVLLMKALASCGQRSAVEREFRRLEKALQAIAARPPGGEARRVHKTAMEDPR